MDSNARARQDAAALPKPDALERILRYEFVLERQIYRATEQLQPSSTPTPIQNPIHHHYHYYRNMKKPTQPRPQTACPMPQS